MLAVERSAAGEDTPQAELRLRLRGPGRAWAGMAMMGMAFGRGAPRR
jgi:hypothetical protein